MFVIVGRVGKEGPQRSPKHVWVIWEHDKNMLLAKYCSIHIQTDSNEHSWVYDTFYRARNFRLALVPNSALDEQAPHFQLPLQPGPRGDVPGDAAATAGQVLPQATELHLSSRRTLRHRHRNSPLHSPRPPPVRLFRLSVHECPHTLSSQL